MTEVNSNTKIKKPFFPFYPGDFLAAIGHWTNEEVGAYIRLLCFEWVNGSIPEDHPRIGRIIGVHPDDFPELWAVVGPKFKPTGNGGLVNVRLEVVRSEVEEISAKRSEAGKLGNALRWQKVSQTDRKTVANGIAKASPSKPKSKPKNYIQNRGVGFPIQPAPSSGHWVDGMTYISNDPRKPHD